VDLLGVEQVVVDVLGVFGAHLGVIFVAAIELKRDSGGGGGVVRALRCKLARMSEGGARLLPDFVGLAPGLASPVAGGLLQQAGEAVRASLERERGRRKGEGKGARSSDAAVRGRRW